MEWYFIALKWYLYLFIIGIIFVPVTKVIFAKWYDFGYSFSKVIGIIAITFTLFVGGILKIVPFYRSSIFVTLLIFSILNWKLYAKNPFRFKKSQFYLILFQEAAFAACLFFWAFVRGQEPSLHGLEKFMDFGFMNSILRSTYFPPLDMWLSGHTINYYYFGHLTGALLIKLISVVPAVGYNLILATIFALGMTQAFSLCFSIVYASWHSMRTAFIAALLGVFIINLGGNLHTIYAFTKGYSNDKPVAPWAIKSPPIGCYTPDSNNVQSWSLYCPQSYWYPNATRFIPFTIHEFPLYSYVVADLHGHVFDIPFVLLTLALLYLLFMSLKKDSENNRKHFLLTTSVGFMCAINYMTNAFDGPIYLLLTLSLLFYVFRLRIKFLIHSALLFISFVFFAFPFSHFFKPFVSGIGVNCSPFASSVVKRFGPFLIEPGNCQHSQWWMLAILWGFFWFNFLFLILPLFKKQWFKKMSTHELYIYEFFMVIFTLGSALLIIPEFFYIKDIYPAHFRANTMFKLGYQAFMMMGVGCAYTFMYYKQHAQKKSVHVVYLIIFGILFFLTVLYPFFAINSYYGKLDKPVQLDGTTWVQSQYPEYTQIINYLNKNVVGQPNIVEAQGDSYTDYDIVSSYTGLPTVAGWLVHQWLWRGSSTIVSDIAPDIQALYETPDAAKAKQIIDRYHITYIIIGTNERTKYTGLQEQKFNAIAQLIFESSAGNGKIYFVK